MFLFSGTPGFRSFICVVFIYVTCKCLVLWVGAADPVAGQKATIGMFSAFVKALNQSDHVGKSSLAKSFLPFFN